MIRDHLKAIRSHHALSSSSIIYICENNMSHESGWHTEVVSEFTNVAFISKRGDDEWGWRTDPGDKKTYLTHTLSALSRNTVFFLEDWKCANSFNNPEHTRDKTLTQFSEQMSRYGEYEVFTGNPEHPRKIVIGGCFDSMGKVSPYLKDDMAFAFTLGVYIIDMLLEKKIENFNYKILGKEFQASSVNTINILNKRKRT